MPSVSRSSVGTVTIPTDYIGAKTTTISVVFTSSTSSAFFQTPMVTLDDPMRVTTPSWVQLSSAANVIYASSTDFDLPFIKSVSTPIAGVRVTCSNIDSGAIVVKVLQNAGG